MQQLLLIKDVGRLGHVGDVVTVNVAYARNYLVPQRLAVEPTEENVAAIEAQKKRAAGERAKRLAEHHKLAEALAEVSVTIESSANPEGTLYGSVGARDIAEALQAAGHAVLPQHVVLESPIRTLDNINVAIRFTDEVETQVKVWVVREGGVQDADTDPDTDPEPEDEPELDDE